MPLFYNHQSDEEIAIHQQTIELNNWIEHFEFIAIEIEYLRKLNILSKNKNLNLELLNKKDENNYLLNLFNGFKNESENAIECMDIACDMYYVNQHKMYREQYLFFIRAYRMLKIEILNTL